MGIDGKWEIWLLICNIIFGFKRLKCLCFGVAADCRGSGNVLLDIRRMCVGGGESWQEWDDHSNGDLNCLGTGCDGYGLLSWTYLRCPFQPCCHCCFCCFQKISMETGKLASPTVTLFSIFKKNNLYFHIIHVFLCNKSPIWVDNGLKRIKF